MKKIIVVLMLLVVIFSGCSKKTEQQEEAKNIKVAQTEYGKFTKRLHGLSFRLGEISVTLSKMRESLGEKYESSLYNMHSDEIAQKVNNLWILNILKRELTTICGQGLSLYADDSLLYGLTGNIENFTKDIDFSFKYFLSGKVNILTIKINGLLKEIGHWMVIMDNPAIVSEMKDARDTLDEMSNLLEDMQERYGLFNTEKLIEINEYWREYIRSKDSMEIEE